MSAAALIPSSSSLEEARYHHAGGHLLLAAEAYRETLQSNPQSQAALLGLSLIARQSNQLQPALNMAQAALASGPANALAWANLGDILTALGQLPQAESIFRYALKLDPTIPAAHYGLGNTLALRDNFLAALNSFQTAAQLAPNIPEFHFAQAFSHGKLGAHPQAIAAYRSAVTLRPGFASAWLNLGVELIADGRPNLAHLCYREALATAPNAGTQISAHLNLGHLARSQRRFIQAQEHYERALARTAKPSATTPQPNPESRLAQDRRAEVQVAFTYLHLEQKQFPQAWQSLQAADAADMQPHNPEIPNVRGILLLAEDTACAYPDLAPVTYPDLAPVKKGMGFSPYINPTQLPWALAPEGQLDLSSKINCEERLHQAIAAFEQAEKLGHKTAASNRGNALLRLGRCHEALAAHQQALDRDPHHPGVRYNLALTQLRLGDYANGWPNYEIRWSFREVHPHPRRFRQPRWQGEPLPENSTLLLYAEQGLGDTLQFIRYLPLAAQRLVRMARNPGAPGLDFETWESQNPHILLEVQPPLVRLLTSHFAGGNIACHPEHSEGSASRPSIQIIPHGHPLPSFTHHCPLMSLPAIFETSLETVPNQIPYLNADRQLAQARAIELTTLGAPSLAQPYRDKGGKPQKQGAPSLTPFSGQGWDQTDAGCPTLATPLSLSLGWEMKHLPRIGLNWAGNPSYRADRERSTHLTTFLPLLEIPGIQWISLQKGDPASQIAHLPPHIALYDGSSHDRDLADTAALIANLDLVITTDTAVAHLAGAMGKPLWLLLPWQSDWRWMQAPPTTPWYPTARLFRQSSSNNWPELIQRVIQEIPAALAQIPHK